MIAVEVLRVASGAVLVAVPRRVVGALEGRSPRHVAGGSVAFAVVLGARHLVQGTGTLLVAGDPAVVLGVAVDAVHAATMVPIAVLSRRHRRAAVANVLSSAVFAGLGALAARTR